MDLKIAIVIDNVLDDYKKRMLDGIKGALEKRYEVGVVPFNEDFMKNVRGYDLAFNMATGGGKDTRQIHATAVLDFLGIPYTTASAYTHAICMDKSVTKSILMKHGFGTANFIVVLPGEKPPKDHGLNYPLIVKLAREGSSKGLRKESVVHNYEELLEAVKWAQESFNEELVVEEFIDGVEITVGMLESEGGIEVLPIPEISFEKLPEGFERFQTDRVKNNPEYYKYLEYIFPARLPDDVMERIREDAKRIFRVLRLRDYGRIDMRVKDGEYYVLEVNSLPLLVPGYSDIPKAAAQAGMSYDEVIYRIVDSARRRYGI